jgi:hypothetical protein
MHHQVALKPAGSFNGWQQCTLVRNEFAVTATLMLSRKVCISIDAINASSRCLNHIGSFIWWQCTAAMHSYNCFINAIQKTNVEACISCIECAIKAMHVLKK